MTESLQRAAAAAGEVGDPGSGTTVADPDVTAVADTFVELMRSFGRAKARFLAAAEDDLEWSAQIVLRHLANEGPMRASALAETLHSDPSTVSRQVATLVRDGLVERRADPQDGRASILVLTERADTVLSTQRRTRNQYFASMLTGWDPQELREFARHLRRFTTDFENASTTLISEGAKTARPSAEGNN